VRRRTEMLSMKCPIGSMSGPRKSRSVAADSGSMPFRLSLDRVIAAGDALAMVASLSTRDVRIVRPPEGLSSVDGVEVSFPNLRDRTDDALSRRIINRIAIGCSGESVHRSPFHTPRASGGPVPI